MALDDATSALVRALAASRATPTHLLSPVEARSRAGLIVELVGAGPQMARVEDLVIPAPQGDIPARLLVPDGELSSIIVYFHGGGWVIGNIEEFDTLGRNIARRTSSAVLMVEYRLAPEHPYPAAGHDALSVTRWAALNKVRIVGGELPLVVMGDSAGGNLAAVVSQQARESGPHIDAQILVYPVTDCDHGAESYRDSANQLLLTTDTMTWFWDQYLPDAARRREPAASPGCTPDLSGLPPAVVVTAEHDILRDEGEAYAAALRDAGVAVDHRRFDGQTHGFFSLVNVLPGAHAALDYVAAHLGRILDGIMAGPSH